MVKNKTTKEKEPYWNDLVSVFFSFCKEKFDTIPSFDGSQPRDLKRLISALRKRCEGAGHIWDYEAATSRFRHFLEYSYNTDRWLADNFLLSNLNRHKDKIFFNISKTK